MFWEKIISGGGCTARKRWRVYGDIENFLYVSLLWFFYIYINFIVGFFPFGGNLQLHCQIGYSFIQQKLFSVCDLMILWVWGLTVFWWECFSQRWHEWLPYSLFSILLGPPSIESFVAISVGSVNVDIYSYIYMSYDAL